MRTACSLTVSTSMLCSWGGGIPACTEAEPPVNRMTNRCKNITLPQTSFAGGEYDCKKGVLLCNDVVKFWNGGPSGPVTDKLRWPGGGQQSRANDITEALNIGDPCRPVESKSRGPGSEIRWSRINGPVLLFKQRDSNFRKILYILTYRSVSRERKPSSFSNPLTFSVRIWKV